MDKELRVCSASGWARTPRHHSRELEAYARQAPSDPTNLKWGGEPVVLTIPRKGQVPITARYAVGYDVHLEHKPVPGST